MKALVVESSRMYQLLLNEFLNGYSITHNLETSGEGALRALAKDPVELIILAMSLPDTTGTELANKIKSKYSQATVVVMTGEQDAIKIQQMKTADVDFVWQRNNVNQLKAILSELTQDDLTFSQASGHVLYIEDHLSVANMTMDIFKQMGLTFDHSSSAEEGLILFENNCYDLVLLDIVLAGKKNGIEMIEEIRDRKDDKHLTPILALSGISKSSEKINALKAGANDFITKPVLQAELAVRAKNLIQARQLYLKMINQQEALEQLAMTDQLTGLYNRYFLNSFIDKALSFAKRHGYPLSLLMIDLDKFKYINDTFGHEQGDEILVKIAEILQNNCRLEDVAVRLGGDEFLVVLPHCSQEQAIIKANNICTKIHAIEASRKEVIAAASFGVSSTDQGSFDYKVLFEMADQAAYQSKSLGGNTVSSQ